jgi:hypothetical protein
MQFNIETHKKNFDFGFQDFTNQSNGVTKQLYEQTQNGPDLIYVLSIMDFLHCLNYLTVHHGPFKLSNKYQILRQRIRK